MAVSHVFTSPVADFTGTVTVFDSNGATATTNATALVRPSNWNSVHNQYMTISGNTAGASTASGTNLVLQGGNNVTLSVTDQTIIFSASQSQSVQTQNMVSVLGSTGNISFANSNGITFGGNASTITASHNGLTSQSNQAVSAGNGSFAFQTLTMADSNGISFSTGTQGLFGTVKTDYALSNHSHGNPTLNLTNLSGTTASNSAGFTLSLSAAAPGGGAAFSAGISGGNTAGDTGTVSNQIVFAGGNNITVSGSTNAGGMSVTISGANAGGAQTGISGIIVSNTTYTSGTVTFQNANGISFGSSGANGISASYTVPTVTNSSWTVSDAATSATVGRLAFTNSNGLTLSLSTSNNGNHTVIGSYTVPTITSWTVSDSATSATVGRLAFTASNGLTLTLSTSNNGNHTVIGSYTRPVVSNAIQSVGSATGSGTNTSRFAADDHVHAGVFSMGVSTGGNTSGDTRVDVGRFVFVGGNNITLSQGTAANGLNTITISAGAGGGVNTGTFYATGNTTRSSTGTIALSSIIVNGSGGISAGISNGSVIVHGPDLTSLSVTGALSASSNGSTISLGVGTVTASATSNTVAVSSGSINLNALIFKGQGAASVGISNGSIVIDAPSAAAGNVTFSAGANSAGLASLVFSNSNGVSFGLNGSTITASAAGGGAESNNINLLGANTAGNTTASGSTIGLSGLNMTLSGTNGSQIVLSAPATSSLVGVSPMSISTNGSTISVILNPVQNSFFMAMPANASTAVSQIGNGTIAVYPIVREGGFSASRADIYASVSVSSSSNSSHAGALSVYAGIYTRNGSTLSLATSGSQSYQWSNTSNNSLGSIASLRAFSIPININYSDGKDLWIAVMSRSSTTNANWFTASNVLQSSGFHSGQVIGLIGEASNATRAPLGFGRYSASSTALLNSMAFSEITGGQGGTASASRLMPNIYFQNFTA